MWENFIGQQIRRCNRNLLIANLVLLGAGITYTSVGMFDYTEEWWWALGIAVPLLFLATWNLSKWKKRARDYTCHPICKRLARFGTVEQVIQQIEAAILTSPTQIIAGVKLFGPWLFKKSFFGLKCFHIPDIVWVYEKVTKHSVNFIPTGKSFAALLYDRYGYCTEIQGSETKVVSLMTHIIQQCPWTIAGFSKDLEKLWQSRKGTFVAAVDERRKEFAKTAAAGAGK
jgi:hypothetical protein